MAKAPRRAKRATRGAVKAGKKTAPKTAKKRPAARKPSRRGTRAKLPARTKLTARTGRSAAKPRGKATTKASAKASTRAATKARNKAKAKARPKAQSARATKPKRPLPSVPSSLSLDRRSSAVRSGRLELADERRKHAGMSPSITGGDVDVDVESAYFTGDEAPGGDNPTPDQEVVDEIGLALGVVYDDAEELRGSEKVSERDRHRWELDPASSEDYRSRK